MKSALRKIAFRNILSNNTLPILLVVLAAIVYLLQSINFAHHLGVTMDEGTYLMKGLLYVKGVYRPFEAYGLVTNKMPLAFYIPGLIQWIFGPGLRTGRYFMVILGLLTLLALWITTKRLAGNRWAAVAVWLVALNPAVIGFTTQAMTQGITACLFAWVFALCLGKNQSLFSILLGSAAAVVVVLVRQNLVPIVPFLILYIFWVHGWRKGLYAALTAGIILITFHIFYWPGIMSLWTPYLPKFLSPLFSGAAAPPSGGISTWKPEYASITRWFAFFEGFRYNFAAVFIPLIAWFLLPRRKQWKDDFTFKTVIFLSTLWIILLGMHAWASVGQDSCVFCFAGYIAFFYPTGILIAVIMVNNILLRPGWIRSLAVSVMVIAGTTAMAFSANQVIDDWLLNLQVPRMREGRIIEGTTKLWGLFANKFGLSYETLQMLLPTIFGFMVGLAFVLAVVLLYIVFKKKVSNINSGYMIAVGFLIAGVLLSPTLLLGGGKIQPDYCSEDVIASHESVGVYLAKVIPAGSLVYWENDLTPLPLLYIPDVKIFPPQLNHWYTYINGGIPDLIARKGFWNAELASQWIRQADYVLLEEKYVNRHPELYDGTIPVNEMDPTIDPVYCVNRSRIHVYQNTVNK